MTQSTLLDTIDADLLSRLTSRRTALRALAKIGTLAASTPVLLAALSQEAFGRGPDMPAGVLDVLNFALLLEHLEDEFYSKALKTPGLIPARDLQVFQTVARDESAHVKLLATATLAPVLTHKFDFTAGGRYPDVFSNYRTFLTVAETFEETGVKAYKGQATNLMHAGLILSIALRIHSVEARHACEIRRLRGQKGWLTEVPGSEGGAFDEALSKDQVLHLVRPFIPA